MTGPSEVPKWTHYVLESSDRARDARELLDRVRAPQAEVLVEGQDGWKARLWFHGATCTACIGPGKRSADPGKRLLRVFDAASPPRDVLRHLEEEVHGRVWVYTFPTAKPVEWSAHSPERALSETWLRRFLVSARPSAWETRLCSGECWFSRRIRVDYVDGDTVSVNVRERDDERPTELDLRPGRLWSADSMTADEIATIVLRKPVVHMIVQEFTWCSTTRPVRDPAVEFDEMRRAAGLGSTRYVKMNLWADRVAVTTLWFTPGDEVYAGFRWNYADDSAVPVTPDRAVEYLRRATHCRVDVARRPRMAAPYLDLHRARARALVPELVARTWAPARHVDWCLDVEERAAVLAGLSL